MNRRKVFGFLVGASAAAVATPVMAAPIAPSIDLIRPRNLRAVLAQAPFDVARMLKASRQILDDTEGLEVFIDERLRLRA